MELKKTAPGTSQTTVQQSGAQTKPTRSLEPRPGITFFRSVQGNITRAEGKEGNRKFTLSFSSEEPYARWIDATEILDHADGAIDLKRLRDIGVVLYNHNRDKVLGKITKAWIENNRGYAEIEFDDDEISEVIFKKVQNGTLKGVSVGYVVDEWDEVTAGKKSADGRFTGPCYIARKWTPYEISIVSVPADPSVGVGRDMEGSGALPESGISDAETAETNHGVCLLSLAEKQIQINKNLT